MEELLKEKQYLLDRLKYKLLSKEYSLHALAQDLNVSELEVMGFVRILKNGGENINIVKKSDGIYIEDFGDNTINNHNTKTIINDQEELKILGDALNNPERPFVGILGGKKVSDKIGVINSLLEKVDVLLIGGAMAFTFLKASNLPIGSSLLDADNIELSSDNNNLIKNNRDSNEDNLEIKSCYFDVAVLVFAKLFARIKKK